MKRSLHVTALLVLAGFLCAPAQANYEVKCWFPPGWEARSADAKAITEALSQNSGVHISPQIAKSYPQIFDAFNSRGYCLVYAGSFTQGIIIARKIGTPLVQVADGKEFYSGILVYPKGEDPAAILHSYPEQIAYAVGASSGESAAKAATNGRASIGVANHNAAAGAVAAGKAKAAFVKNWWWEASKAKYPGLVSFEVPGVSEAKNPDNVLTASKSIPEDLGKKIASAASACKEAFRAQNILPFNAGGIEFSLALMKKGQIDPLTYTW